VQENVVRLNGRRATYLAILKKADASTLAVVEGAREQIPVIQAAAPEGMELKIDSTSRSRARGDRERPARKRRSPRSSCR